MILTGSSFSHDFLCYPDPTTQLLTCHYICMYAMLSLNKYTKHFNDGQGKNQCSVYIHV